MITRLHEEEILSGRKDLINSLCGLTLARLVRFSWLAPEEAKKEYGLQSKNLFSFPETFELWGCKAELKFPLVKLLDFPSRWSELEQSLNPFAVVVMAHLQGQRTRQDPQGRP